MAQILVRKIDDDLKARLRRRAAAKGVSMETEARAILQEALQAESPPEFKFGSYIAGLFSDVPDNDEALPELPDEPLRVPDFGA